MCLLGLPWQNTINWVILKNRNLFSQSSWKMEVQDQGVGRSGFSWGLSLACSWPFSPWILTQSFLCVCIPGVSSSFKDIGHVGLVSYPNSLILTYLNNGQVDESGQIDNLIYLQIRLHFEEPDAETSASEFRRNTDQSRTTSISVTVIPMT